MYCNIEILGNQKDDHTEFINDLVKERTRVFIRLIRITGIARATMIFVRLLKMVPRNDCYAIGD